MPHPVQIELTEESTSRMQTPAKFTVRHSFARWQLALKHCYSVDVSKMRFRLVGYGRI